MAFGITAIVGYDALVSDYQHYVGILERDPVQIQRFFAAYDHAAAATFL